MKLKFKIDPKTGEPFKLMSSQLETLKIYCKEPRYPDWSEMGAGKTWPAALIALGAYEDGLIDHAIIVCPKVVLGDWINVYRNIIDTDFRTNVVLYYAPKSVLPHITLKPIIVTSYEMIMGDLDRFMRLAKNKRVAVIYDEAHKLKNHDSKRT
jgi:SNF2 family DNA or RNA helicase